jgi:hypothetical protein
MRYALVIAAVAGICGAMPAGADEVGVGAGPVGVTVGTGHGDGYRDPDRDHDRTVVRDRDDRRDRDPVVIKDRDHSDRDRDGNSVILDQH